MLVIRADLVELILAHARAEQVAGEVDGEPGFEACGLVAGPEGTERPERHIPMRNAALDWTEPQVVKGRPRSARTYFDFDPAEKLAVYRELDRRDEWPVITYHSHSHTEAYPSAVDVDIMSGPLIDPRIHWVVVSTRAGANEFRSFRIVDGAVVEEDVEVVESYMFAHTGADDVPDNS